MDDIFMFCPAIPEYPQVNFILGQSIGFVIKINFLLHIDKLNVSQLTLQLRNIILFSWQN